MNVLVLNAGSSTLKFQLVRTDPERMVTQRDERLARGMYERIGGESVFTLTDSAGATVRGTVPLRDHRNTLDHLLSWMASDAANVPISSIGEIEAVGHRVVHGGERFMQSALVNEDVLRGIEEMIDLAPLHNSNNMKGIMAARAALGAGVPQVAVFDTAFHHTLPDHAYLYALPYQWYRRHRVRRYGFHGTSYRYVAWRYRQHTGLTKEQTNIIALHLGNGCSACAIQQGKSLDTSMGFTPLEGLVMGTRAGDIDPAILDFMASKEGLSLPELENLLNKQSGLLGISGLTNDMRELLAEEAEHGDRRARLAVDLFAYRTRKYIGGYLAAMNGAEAIVFCGGIGENAASVRSRICAGLEWLGVTLDADRNGKMVGGAEGRIDAEGSRVQVWVIPTDEELLIARDTARVILGIEHPT